MGVGVVLRWDKGEVLDVLFSFLLVLSLLPLIVSLKHTDKTECVKISFLFLFSFYLFFEPYSDSFRILL